MAILLVFNQSCKQDTEELVTFESIEKEFKLKKPFTEISKKNILNKFGSLNEYRMILKNQITKIEENKKKSNTKIFALRKVNDANGEKQKLDSYRKNIFSASAKSADWGFCNGSLRVNMQTPAGFKSIGQYIFGFDSILKDAEDFGIDLPYSCRAGACGVCAAQLKQGQINQDDQTFLDSEQVERGYVLLCVSYAITDCLIRTHTENEL